MSGGVARAMRSGRLNTPPNTAIVVAQSSATVSVAPATALTLPGSPAPQACPIRTVAPELSPMTKATKKEHHREKNRDGRQRIDPDHLAEVHVVDGAEQRLQNIAQHHWREENQKCLPEGRVRHGVSLLVGVTGRGHATLLCRR